MDSDKCIKLIDFDGKYISGEAKEVLIDPTYRKYVIKGITGIGGTTAILNYSRGNYIIVSPNVGMIKSKQEGRGTYQSDKQFFIYQDSKDQWKDVIEYLESTSNPNAIINITPDQIVNIKDVYYQKLIKIPLFIDEAHLYVQDADYRNSMGSFMELVYNEWEASFTLSTATPFYNFWDVPKEIDLKYYKVSPREMPEKQLAISYDKKAIKEFVYEQHELGRLVVVFTNNKNLHTSFRDLRVANLVGDTLRIKIAPYKRGISLDELDFSQTDVLILSSSYYAGFDINHDCSILIVSDQSNDAWKVNVNNIVQAYGRCRKRVYEALLVNLVSKSVDGLNVPKTAQSLSAYHENYLSKLTSMQTLIQDESLMCLDGIRDYVVNRSYINRPKLMTELIQKVDDYHLYNEKVLEHALGSYNFKLSKYISHNEVLLNSIGVHFSERIKNLIELDEAKLLSDYQNIKFNLKNKTDGTFSPKLGLEYLTAYLLKISDAQTLINKLDNKRMYANEFYKYFHAMICFNGSTKNLLHKPTKQYNDSNRHHKNQHVSEVLWDNIGLTDQWHMLYRIYQIYNNQFSDKVSRNLKVEGAINDEDIYIKYIDSGNRCSNTQKAIISKLSHDKIELNKKELVRLKRKVKENFNRLRNSKTFKQYYNPNYLKKAMKEAIIYCLTNGKYGTPRIVDYREYSPLTALPKSLRSIIPIKYVEVDLTSANAQFVDLILGTNVAGEVYQNIMTNMGITRDEAKWKYNSTLNNHKLSVSAAAKFYRKAGYPSDKALELAKMTANTTKGKFFKLMTQYEERLIELYNEIVDFKGLRFHDALVVKESYLKDMQIVLPTIIKTGEDMTPDFISDIEIPENKLIHFHIAYYNNIGQNYDGEVTNEVFELDSFFTE